MSWCETGRFLDWPIFGIGTVMPQMIHHVQPPLTPITPHYNIYIVRLTHLILPILLRFQFFPWLPAGIKTVDVINGKTLAQYYQQFQQGKIRLILAFRHVEVDDPLCGLQLLSRHLPTIAREQGIALDYPLHAHFLYDRGMPLWGGDGLGWMLSRFGGVSLHRGKRPDWLALRLARELVCDGQFPFVVAPEGATNGHSELIGPLEPGVAQLAFWCAEDLAKVSRNETVWLIPVGLQYFYPDQPWDQLTQLMADLEQTIGLPIQPPSSDIPILYQRLLTIGEALLNKLEQFYQQFYPHASNRNLAALPTHDLPTHDLGMRIQVLLDRVLSVAEAHFGMKAQGSPVDRCRQLEEAAWARIYRSDVAIDAAPIDRGLADWVAQEASLRIIHMRLAESFVAVSGGYVAEKPSFERFAETSLIMFDALARLRGDQLPQRPRLGLRQARLTICEPISISDRWQDYRTSRLAAKQAIVDLTTDIRQALEASIL
jgi:hypothetical protein